MTRTHDFALALFFLVAGASCTGRSCGAELLSVGAATLDVTPDYPIRLNGYESRMTEATGIDQHVVASALVIGGDDGDGPAVLIALENCEILPDITNAVARNLKKLSDVSAGSH